MFNSLIKKNQTLKTDTINNDRHFFHTHARSFSRTVSPLRLDPMMQLVVYLIFELIKNWLCIHTIILFAVLHQ